MAIKKYHANYWTTEKVLQKIKEHYHSGQSLRSWDIRNSQTSVYHAAYKLFGNWKNAVEAAGIDYNSLLKNPWKWNKDNIKEKLIELRKQSINLSDVGLRKYDKTFYSAVTKKFGSVYDALEYAGVDSSLYRIKHNNEFWTEERALNEAKKLKNMGEDLSSQNIRKKYSKLWNVSMKKFGGWINILTKIRIKPSEISRLYANTKEFKRYLENELTEDELEDLYYNQGFSELAIGEMYNCGYKPIQRLLKRHGLIPHKSKFGLNKGIICSDGHKVMSSYEMQVCEWLTRHKIKHEHNVKLNYSKYDGNTKIKVPKYRPDFMIMDRHKTYYIEVWGLAGIKEYDEKTKKKLELYKELKEKFGYELIEIYPKDKLINKLGFLINKKEIMQTLSAEPQQSHSCTKS